MKREDITKLVQGATEKAQTVKKVVRTGVATSKTMWKGASRVINKDGIAQGLEATAKGAELAAKGARLASRGAQTIAGTIEKASTGMKKITAKLKK